MVRGCCCGCPGRSRCFACTSKRIAQRLRRSWRARRRSGYWKSEEEIEEGACRREDWVADAPVRARAFGIADAGDDCARRFWDTRIFGDATDAKRDSKSE